MAFLRPPVMQDLRVASQLEGFILSFIHYDRNKKGLETGAGLHFREYCDSASRVLDLAAIAREREREKTKKPPNATLRSGEIEIAVE